MLQHIALGLCTLPWNPQSATNIFGGTKLAALCDCHTCAALRSVQSNLACPCLHGQLPIELCMVSNGSRCIAPGLLTCPCALVRLSRVPHSSRQAVRFTLLRYQEIAELAFRVSEAQAGKQKARLVGDAQQPLKSPQQQQDVTVQIAQELYRAGLFVVFFLQTYAVSFVPWLGALHSFQITVFESILLLREKSRLKLH